MKIDCRDDGGLRVVLALLTTGVLQDERIKGLPVPPGVYPNVNWRGYNKGPFRPKRGTCARTKGPAHHRLFVVAEERGGHKR